MVKSQDTTTTATDATVPSESDGDVSENAGRISHLLEGVLNADEDAVKKAIADGESIDTVNVNGW